MDSTVELRSKMVTGSTESAVVETDVSFWNTVVLVPVVLVSLVVSPMLFVVEGKVVVTGASSRMSVETFA